MSADNGIYILKTLTDNDDYEYRVQHLQAVENVDWDANLTRETDDPDVHIANARLMWHDANVYTSESQALEEAAAQLKRTYICEYGISFITIDRKF